MLLDDNTVLDTGLAFVPVLRSSMDSSMDEFSETSSCLRDMPVYALACTAQDIPQRFYLGGCIGQDSVLLPYIHCWIQASAQSSYLSLKGGFRGLILEIRVIFC